RGLQRAVARRGLPLMALVLNKIRNAASARCRPRPLGLTGEPSLVVTTPHRRTHAFKVAPRLTVRLSARDTLYLLRGSLV
ncbi:MAG: hypothetical protein AAF662_14845, partial [Pseudomonadota bacterium]